MTLSIDTYLKCYKNLNDPSKSKLANKTLLMIQQSDRSWKLAEQLMMDQTNHIHGIQLLSKKLDSKLPLELDSQVLVQFIISFQQLTSLHWLCLSKIFIHTHLDVDKLQVTGSLPPQTKLNILKQIPYALTPMKITLQTSLSNYRKQVYKQNKYLVLQSVRYIVSQGNGEQEMKRKLELNQIILEVLQSFTSNNVPLQSDQIALFMLNQPQIDRVVSLLEYIFIQQKYPHLQNLFEQFIQKHMQSKNNQWIKTVYINFYTQKDIYILSLDNFKSVVDNVSKLMKQESFQDFKLLLADSFQFWSHMCQPLLELTQTLPLNLQIEQNMTEDKIQIQKLKFVQSALMGNFNILCQSCLLKKCPQKVKNIHSKLDIVNLDPQDEQKDQAIKADANDQINFEANQIRALAQDFFIKIFSSLRCDKALHKQLYHKLYLLGTNQQNLQYLQLAIFIVDTLSDFSNKDDIQYLSKIVQIILKQQNRLNQYICSKIITVLSKVEKIVASNSLQIIPLIFQFFSKTIFYQKLSVSASQSFLQLMQTYNNLNEIVNMQFKQKTQTYLNLWFQSFYGSIQNEKVLQNITKALTIFIFKFKGANFYELFHSQLELKLSLIQNCSYQLKCLQAVTSAQFWINCQEPTSLYNYLMAYGNFMNKYIQLMYNNCLNANKKQEISKGINKISWAIKAGCFYTSLKDWLLILRNLLQRTILVATQNIYPIGLTPYIALLKSNIRLPEHTLQINKAIQQVLPLLINKLVVVHSQRKDIQYSLTKYVVQLVNLYINQLQQQQKPVLIDRQHLCQLFNFIVQKIFGNKLFWQYEVMKESLIFMHQLANLNFNLHLICIELIKVCPRTFQSLWVQTQNIFFAIYSTTDINFFIQVLQIIRPQILRPNPLFTLLQNGLKHSDRKMLKSFVKCL